MSAGLGFFSGSFLVLGVVLVFSTGFDFFVSGLLFLLLLFVLLIPASAIVNLVSSDFFSVEISFSSFFTCTEITVV